jgi:hypothetical protein
VGIHVGGHEGISGRFNVAARLNIDMLQDILTWTTNPLYLPKRIVSEAFDKVCLKVSQGSSSDIEVISHYCDDASDASTIFRLVPIQGYPSSMDMAGSSALADVSCAIGSDALKGAYLYMDTAGVDAGKTEGGKVEAKEWINIPAMNFILQKRENSSLLKNASDKPIYLRIDGTGLKMATPDGSVGSVGCKFVTSMKDPMQLSFCRLFLKEKLS